MRLGDQRLGLVWCWMERLLTRRPRRPFDQTCHFIWLGNIDRVAGGNLDRFAAGPLGHVALEIGIDVVVASRDQRPALLLMPGGRLEVQEIVLGGAHVVVGGGLLREQANCTLALVGDESGDVDEADDIRRIARFGDDHPAIAVADQKGRTLLQIQQPFCRVAKACCSTGTFSLIFWSLIIVISLKYAILIMRADNHGEGGILALLALGLALALSIPETFLWRRPIVATTFAVVAFSIIVQGLTSRPLLRRTCRQDLQLNDPA